MPITNLRSFLPYNDCIIAVYNGGQDPIEEFSIENEEMMKKYEKAWVSEVWILNEDGLVASAYL